MRLPISRLSPAAMAAILLTGTGLTACSAGGAYSDRSEITTYSLPPRPTEGMVSAPARPYGQGYGLGRRETAAASAGQYRWNGNPTRIQEGAPPARTTPPAIPVTTADGQRTITVQPGDTLYSLARHHGVSVVALAEANNLMTNSIHAGQRLVLPPAAR